MLTGVGQAEVGFGCRPGEALKDTGLNGTTSRREAIL